MLKNRVNSILCRFLFYAWLTACLSCNKSAKSQSNQEAADPVVSALAPYFGLYESADGKNGLMLGMLDKYPVLFFPDGRVRGIFESEGHFVIGNAIGKRDSTEGSIRFEKKKGMRLVRTGKDGSEITAERILLKEKEVSFSGTKKDFIERQKDFKKTIRLQGSLVFPAGKGPFPAIVFAHGSGQESRDGSRGLAMFFARNGIACFIFDKRGVGGSEGEHWAASFSDYADDLLAAVSKVKEFPEIDKDRVGLYGHSQGGWVVPLAISKSPGAIAFAILSAANAVSPLDQHMYNGRRALGFRGIDSATVAEVETFRRNKYAATLGRIPKEKFYQDILPAAQQRDWLSKQKLTNEELGVDEFFEYNCYYDPRPALSGVQCPLLILYGQKDNFTSTETNYPLMQDLFRENGNRRVTIKIFENANHALLHTDRGWFFNRELPALKHFADGYFELLLGWVKETTGNRKE